MGDGLKRAGRAVRRLKRGHAPPRTEPPVHAEAPNQVGSVDFKGNFAAGDGQMYSPLTMTDNAGRYLLRCWAPTRTGAELVQPMIEGAFRE